jgi:hypothetical protein
MFMAFSLVAFSIATYIELEKRHADIDSLNKLSEIRNILSSIDANLGGKYESAVRDAPDSIRRNLQFFEDNLCKDVKRMKVLLNDGNQSQCTISRP